MRAVEGARHLRRRVLVGSLSVLVGLVFVTPLARAVAATVAAEDPEVKILDEDKVYYPRKLKKGASYRAPATIETSKVFDEISEWKEIERKKLTPKDAEYHLLLKAANKKFDKAIKKVQKKDGYDIIAEDGAIECKHCEAKVITQETIDSLGKDD